MESSRLQGASACMYYVHTNEIKPKYIEYNFPR